MDRGDIDGSIYGFSVLEYSETCIVERFPYGWMTYDQVFGKQCGYLLHNGHAHCDVHGTVRGPFVVLRDVQPTPRPRGESCCGLLEYHAVRMLYRNLNNAVRF
jgi:hypothetical protein